MQQALEKLYAAEKPLAVVEPSERDANVLRLGGARSYKKGDPQAVTQLVVSATQWNRVARLLDRKTDVEVEIDVRATFHEDDTNGYNVVAELPGHGQEGRGRDGRRPPRLVAPGHGRHRQRRGLRGHDGGVRILKAIDAKPRRTVRIGLWGGEEQGLLGSRAYVSEHFASRPEPKEAGPDELPSFMRNEPPAPLTLKPDHAKLSAYFNLDNGTGKIRGVYLQENAAVRPVFEAWLESVKDLGGDPHHDAQHRRHRPPVLRRAWACPASSSSRTRSSTWTATFFGTHHTDMDTYDRLQRDDLMQAAVVIATFAYNAADARRDAAAQAAAADRGAARLRPAPAGKGARRAARSRRRRPWRPPRGPGRAERGTGAGA